MTSTLAEESKRLASKASSKVTQDIIRERDKAFRRTCGTIRKKDDAVNGLVRMAATGVGLVSEALHHRRARKDLEREEKGHEIQQSTNAAISEQLNEAIWNLDTVEQEAAEKDGDSQSPKSTKTPSDLAEAFIQRHPFPNDTNQNDRLALPVILPQRRPENRARGFVRAYAPVLAGVGIDQATFLDFIDTFNKVLEPSPWLNAINIAGSAGEAAPEPFTFLIGIGAEVVTDAAMEAHSRFKSNNFLDRVNAVLFAPRGLACLVATWRPEASDEMVTTVDFTGRTVEFGSTEVCTKKVRYMEMQGTSGREKILQTIRNRARGVLKSSSAAVASSEPAPLIFPALERTVNERERASEKVKKKNAVNRAEIWLDNYKDKHTQAEWREENSELPAANLMPKPEYWSRYADPNHPAASGDIVAFFTGGRWQYGHGKPLQDPMGDERASREGDRDKTTSDSKEMKKKEKEKEKVNKKESEKEKKMSKEKEKNKVKVKKISKEKDKPKAKGDSTSSLVSNLFQTVRYMTVQIVGFIANLGW